MLLRRHRVAAVLPELATAVTSAPGGVTSIPAALLVKVDSLVLTTLRSGWSTFLRLALLNLAIVMLLALLFMLR
jgi:hypothetical protein